MGNKQSREGDARFKLKQSDVRQLSKETNLDKVEIKNLEAAFRSVAPNGSVDRTSFQQALKILESSGLKEISNTPYADRLFSLLDVNQDGAVDFKEFISGFALLCKGTVEDKIKISFDAYDKDGSGSISRDELEEMFKSAWMAGFKAMKSTNSNAGNDMTPEEINEFCENCAKAFSATILQEMDTDGDGQLSFEEFRNFALQEPFITATLSDFEQQINIMF